MSNTPMTPDELLKWGRIAAEAAGYNPIRDVTLEPNPDEPDLQSVDIAGYTCKQTRFADGDIGWHIGDDTYESLIEALAEMLSQACFCEVEQALLTAGLKWEVAQ